VVDIKNFYLNTTLKIRIYGHQSPTSGHPDVAIYSRTLMAGMFYPTPLARRYILYIYIPNEYVLEDTWTHYEWRCMMPSLAFSAVGIASLAVTF
jgi:hypothetical protein